VYFSCELKGGKKPKMRKLLKSKKALSPVIAAIILIAVTVAVSIAVAVWMGSLTFNFMETRELQVTSMTFGGTSTDDGNYIVLDVTNPGTGKITLQGVKLNDQNANVTSTSDTEFNAGDLGTITLENVDWESGYKYRVALVASDGTLVGAFEKTA
jgi:flagellin-like protein